MSDYDPFWEQPDPGDLMVDQEWLDYLERREQERADRMERFADPGNTFTACVLCGERPGKSIYGCHCQQCFEARREEREAA